MNILKKLLKGISSWKQLEERISSLDSVQERGKAFEEFCEKYFELNPVYQAKNVYPGKIIPPSILRKLGHPGKKDVGIDGVIETTTDEIHAYQAKFRSNPNDTPSWRELSTFYGISDKADYRFVITNSNKLPKQINERLKQGRITSGDLNKLDKQFFGRLGNILEDKNAEIKKYKPHRTQREVIDAGIKYFADNDRGKLILPCGTGKTLASLWLTEELDAKKILVMVPSLALMRQTLGEWSEQSNQEFDYICLCSDSTVAESDSIIENTYEMDVRVSTNAEEIIKFLGKNIQKRTVLFSTYQSSNVLSEAVLRANTKFDVGIFDEAHRTTGTRAGMWNIAVDDTKVPIKKRLFMTATPRVYSPHIKNMAQENELTLFSMDEPDSYGDSFYEMTFGDAIKQNLITDYKIIIVGCSDPDVKHFIDKNKIIIDDSDKQWNSKDLAKRIALSKAINKHKLRKIFTFHNTVKSAESFTKDFNYGIKNVYESLNPKSQSDLSCFHVNGKMSTGDRLGYLNEFNESNLGIMSNARCLTEGVDLPSVDAIAFIDPKQSTIDIVQATGRALRKSENKNYGYIFVPIFLEDADTIEEVISNTSFDVLWKVIVAMSDQDERQSAIISDLRTMQGEGVVGTTQWNRAMKEFQDRISFIDIPKKFSQKEFTEKLNLRLVEVSGNNWNFWYGLTLRYLDRTENANCLAKHKENGHMLGEWQSNQRKNYKLGKLSASRIERLNKIGFIWDIITYRWEKGYEETRKYKDLNHGNANCEKNYFTDEDYFLGSWQNNQHTQYKLGKLSASRIERLNKIGFIWDINGYRWEKGYEETRKYKDLNHGNANCVIDYVTDGDYPLGTWQINQRTNYKLGKLPASRIERLNKIGFIWDIITYRWEKGYEETRKYKDLHGNANCKYDFVTEDDYTLGEWQSDQRDRYNLDKFVKFPERKKKLDEIGFSWVYLPSFTDPSLSDDGRTIEEQKWDIGYEETLIYYRKTGFATALFNYVNKDTGFHLWQWQARQKDKYRIQNNLRLKKGILQTKRRLGVLTDDQIKRFDDIGFVWLTPESAWEHGYKESVKYKKEHRTVNAPLRYKVNFPFYPVYPKIFPLGHWQQKQRISFQDNKLSKDRFEKLNKLGFQWLSLEYSAWLQGYNESLRLYIETGSANCIGNKYITEDTKYNLTAFQSRIKYSYKQKHLSKEERMSKNIGKITQEQIDALLAIDFNFSPGDKKLLVWDQYYEATRKYKDVHGKANCPYGYVTEDGYRLGKWQSNQIFAIRSGMRSMSKVRQDKLISLGFIIPPKKQYDTYSKFPDTHWEEFVSETIIYSNFNGGVVNCKTAFVTANGFPLFRLQRKLKEYFKKSKLSSDKIKIMEDLGFIFKPKSRQPSRTWQTFYDALVHYKKNEGRGNPNCSDTYVDSNKAGVGRWLQIQKSNCYHGNLAKKEHRLLRELGVNFTPIYETNEIKWEKGYEETRKYKDLHGNANCRADYVTDKGYNLGEWQSSQRKSYHHGGKRYGVKKHIVPKLTPEQIKRLEGIGFLWTLPHPSSREYYKLTGHKDPRFKNL